MELHCPATVIWSVILSCSLCGEIWNSHTQKARDVKTGAGGQTGRDDTADDLGNMMCKNDTGHLCCTPSTPCVSVIKTYERVDVCVHKSVHVLVRVFVCCMEASECLGGCLRLCLHFLDVVTLLPRCALSLDLLLFFEEAGRSFSFLSSPPPSPPPPSLPLQHLPAFMSALAEQSSPQGRWVCSYHVSGKYII